ncbi:MAG: phosphotransferase system enzyme I (PtsI) [Parasphingorhabdus sp.]
MLLLNGTGIGDIAIGRALLLDRANREIKEYSIDPVAAEDEVKRFNQSVIQARQGLDDLRNQLPASAPAEITALLGAHLLIMEDPLLIEKTIKTIHDDNINAEAALARQANALTRIFENMQDAYLQSKKHDIAQVVDRIQAELAESASPVLSLDGDLSDRIIVVDDLTPADTVLFKHNRMAGFVTNLGGPISHTAILARSLKTPAVVGLHGANRFIRDGETIVIDGNSGSVLVNPDETLLVEFQRRLDKSRRYMASLDTLKDYDTISEDGERIRLLANIELPEDLPAVRAVNAEGVGLYRTEFLFMNRDAPDEQEQYEAYTEVVQSIAGPVTIRTLDLGADKQVDGGRTDQRHTVNPALGLRAIRLCLGNPGLFIPQLRAIFRASVHGNIKIMIPMLSSMSELEQVLDLVREVKNQLSKESIQFDPDIPIGGMIEVPAAAISADLFARKLDFLSIGTNDLIQYTLAIDRIDDEVNYLYDPLHPSVLRLIKTTIDAGRNNNISVAMCGEMAGDPTYTRVLLGMGLKEFSMDPASLLEVKKQVLQSRVDNLSELAEPALASLDPARLRELFKRAARIH